MAAAGRTGNEDPGGWKEGRVRGTRGETSQASGRCRGSLRRWAGAAALSLALVLAAPAGSAGATTTTGKTVKVSTAKVAGVGTVLTTASGLTLYRFTKDSDGRCRRARVRAPKSGHRSSRRRAAHVSGPKGVKGLSLISVGNGHWQVAFHERPLYRFEGDKKKGQAHGQNEGEVWFAVLKSGIPATSGRRPGRDVDHCAGRVDDAADDVDDARFALGHGIELRWVRVERPRTRPAAGHAGDDAADFTADDTGDVAADFAADDPTPPQRRGRVQGHLGTRRARPRTSATTAGPRAEALGAGASGGGDADHGRVEVTAPH